MQAKWLIVGAENKTNAHNCILAVATGNWLISKSWHLSDFSSKPHASLNFWNKHSFRLSDAQVMGCTNANESRK